MEELERLAQIRDEAEKELCRCLMLNDEDAVIAYMMRDFRKHLGNAD